jgi:enoyl-CoA hydratase/carnithine racemase
MSERLSAERVAKATDPLRHERRDAVLILTMDQPASRNSLSEAMLGALRAAIDDAAKARDIRAIVLTANGPAFCAGHDLKEMTRRRADNDGGAAYFQQIMQQCSALMQAIIRCPKPVIAAVQGTATAAGCQLVATCDLAVATEDAHFATPGVNIGLFCSTPMVALSRNLARKRAIEMLLLGEMVPARVAAEYGLINRVVPRAKLQDEALAMAVAIASKAPATVAIGKEAFYAQVEMPLSEAYAYATNIMVKNMLQRDAEEGICAFIEKRKPRWQDC